MSTPIGQLNLGNDHQQSFDASMEQPNMNPPSDTNMVNQVLERVQTMEDDPHASNISGGMMSHNMDPSQIPPEQQYNNNYMPEEEPIYYQHGPMEPETESWSQKIQNGVKGPFIVFIIALIINLPHITRILTHFIPRLLQESGQLNFYGVIVKALMIASLYGLVCFATN
jgi:hypothetical protein